MKAVLSKNAHYHGATSKKGDNGVACLKCHAPHSSSYAMLLKGSVLASYGKSARTKDVTTEYGLCFQCHKDLFRKTNFRNGATNLHAFHVQRKKKSYGCFACHDAHATQNPALVRGSFNYYGREVEMQYVQSKNGGTCATACHAKLGYER